MSAQTLRTSILALLMVIPMLASVNVAAEFPVTAAQTVALEDYFQDHDSPPGGPHGEWQVGNEDTRFWLQGDTPTSGSDFYSDDPTATDPGATCNPGWNPCHLWTDTKPETVATGAYSWVTGEVGAPAGPGGVAQFTAAPAHRPAGAHPGWDVVPALQDTHVFGVGGRFMVQTSSLGSYMIVRVHEIDATGNDLGVIGSFALEPDNNPSLNPGTGLYTVSYTRPIGPFFVGDGVSGSDIDGILIEQGNALRFDISAHNPDYCGDILFNGCTLNDILGGGASDAPAAKLYHAASFVEVRADSVRANLWTENRLHQVTDNFPHAALAGTIDRRVHIKAAVINSWGVRDNPNTIAAPMSGGHTQTDNLHQNNVVLRVRDLTVDHDSCNPGPCYGQVVRLDPAYGLQYGDPGVGDNRVRCCSAMPPSAPIPTTPVVYDDDLENTAQAGIFTYTMVYGSYGAGATTTTYEPGQELFPDGKYQVEMFETGRRWLFTDIFHVGNSGYEFEFAPGEGVLSADERTASHTVYVGEPTEYVVRVTNNGGSADTYGLTTPTVGDGWAASITPSSLSLVPGAHGDVTVRITPATTGPLAQAGDFKTIVLTATSLEDNTAKTLSMVTTLTGARQHGIEVTTELLEIQTRPGFTTLAPVTLRNTGTVQDVYAVTTAGAPLTPPTAEGEDPAAGWTISVSPSTPSILAGARTDILLNVRAPEEAVPGTTCTICSFALTVKATLISDTGVQDFVLIPVEIFLIDNVVVDPFDETLTIRDLGHSKMSTGGLLLTTTDPVQSDNSYDHAPVFRFNVLNDGDRPDTYEIFSSWVPGVGSDVNQCDGPRNGVPDGWRFRILDTPHVDPANRLSIPSTFTPASVADGLPVIAGPGPQTGIGAITGSSGFSGEIDSARLTLPAHSSQDVYLELYWVIPTDSNNNDAACGDPPTTDPRYYYTTDATRDEYQSLLASLRVTTRSSNDPTVRDAHTYAVTTIGRAENPLATSGSNRYPSSLNDVHIGMANEEPDTKSINVDSLGSSTGFTTYTVRTTNTGNEIDGHTITVGANRDGWLYGITGWRILEGQETRVFEPSQPSQYRKTCSPPVTTGSPAPLFGATPATTKQISCDGLGVGDVVLVDVRVTPPNTARLGDVDQVDVSVSSKRWTPAGSGATTAPSDVIELITRIRGDYGFEVEELAGERIAQFGQTVALPFTLSNIGDENDRYDITLLEGDSDWIPALSSNAQVGIPAGRDFHGYLSAVVPDDLPIPTGSACTAPNPDKDHLEQFRVRFDSVLSPIGSQQPKTIDLFVRVPCDTSVDFTLESPPVTIRSDDNARVAIAASGALGQSPPDFVEFSVRAQDLPDGFGYACPYVPTGSEFFPDSCLTPSGSASASNPVVPCTSASAPKCFDSRSFTAGGTSVGDFTVTAPANQLGASRVVSRIEATDPSSDDVQTFHDAILNLASTYGIKLTTPVANQTIPPAAGVGLTYQVTVSNTGLSPATVNLDHSPLPGTATPTTGDDWQIAFSTRSVHLEAGAFEVVEVTLSAPPTATIGLRGTVLITGTVVQDTTKVAQLQLMAEVGEFSVKIDTPFETQDVEPQDTVNFRVSVKNDAPASTNGQYEGVEDAMKLIVDLPAIYEDRFTVTWVSGCDYVEASQVEADYGACFLGFHPLGNVEPLAAQETREVIVSLTLPTGIQSGNLIEFPVVATSLFSVVATDSAPLRMRMLDHIAADIDGDDRDEYAIDADKDPANGYEKFREDRETLVTFDDDTDGNDVGILAAAVDLPRFLSDSAREDRTFNIPQADGSTLETFIYGTVDGDGDDKFDHFVDTTKDGLPDLYWDPDTGAATLLKVTLDVSGDGVREYFIDIDGDTLLDTYFNLVEGAFGCDGQSPLLRRFVDEDDQLDYVVDLDCNGDADPKDPVLIAGPAGIGSIARIIQRVDMDGDGTLDEVVDIDGDGNPNFFVPNGKDTAIPIVLKDVTGDGVLDWTYASDGEGKPDSYYDPATGKAGFIDTQAQFMRDLQEFWYVGALFVLVLVLFIVLVAVTRR